MFNNFSILSELIVENRTLAERFLENLSSVYRYVIQNLKRDTVPVSEELDFLRSYLYLIGMRYENAISVDVDEQLERTDGRIPPVCLQLLVENAIKHNRLSVHQPLHIHVFREGNHIVVKNDLCPVSSDLSSTGIGQRNIIERYFLLCEEKPVIKKSEHSYIVNNYRGTGIGKKLVTYAINHLQVTKVDVNEQNIQAVGFYKYIGFNVYKRSDLDGEGKEYPILHMQL